ncbi:divisome protein SepX/GlpR [Kribbella sp. CA-293567]|uniref:divisome protein SepX/GlpR n=1 Tax=Kribbella sp. CA-293567 TaxID=3002436 RepID=UPI0022DD78B6|nr:hypothetical protein [Kribbella sp. CA-293567]WBQ06722.1 hypothetical protein OX958_07985 [Kribbella sp. CA-293567]
MGTTGLIYVAIVAAWAAYLVPMLLKRNDEATARRSAEKYSSSAARVLSRQSDVQARSRYVVRPLGSADPFSADTASPDGASADEVAEDLSPPARYVPNRARRVAAMRRRRVLSILTLSLLTVVALASFQMLSWWSVTVPTTLIVAFVVLTRVQLRRQARERAALAAERRAKVELHHDRGPATAPSLSPEDHELTIEVKLPEIAEPVAPKRPEPRTDGLWDPVPVTLPTYVMKEKAPDRTVRTISLSGPEVFSSARVAEPEPEAAPVVPEPAPAPIEEPEIRRAVGD